MTKYIDADIFVTHCCNSCIKNGVSCCPTVDSCDYIEDLQAFLVDAPAAADRLEQQEQQLSEKDKRIAELERELAAASIKSTNRCTHFVFNPMDALGLVTEYAPRKERDWKENQGRLPI